MSRKQLVREDDLARIVKAVRATGLKVTEVHVDQAGKVVVISREPGETPDEGPGSIRAELEALRRRGVERRAERAASRERQAG